ncbi:uncharacterized protein LOC124809231 [Hydra vulgaris]|uniref:uncharacterized protein LOC124809231 n=1 Tax=Hydra vulgaris TaxID=6087 RepID=UPI001F5FA000|nr:uncharacterized protein LOC124809231 [Hydra vulgaris]
MSEELNNKETNASSSVIKKKNKVKQRICRSTHGLVSKIKNLKLFNKDEDMAFLRSQSWRSCDEGSLGENGDSKSNSDCKLYLSDKSLLSSSSCESLDGSCLWEVYTFPDVIYRDSFHDKVLQPAKFSVTSLTKISTPTKKSKLKLFKSIRDIKSTQKNVFKAKALVKKEKITDYFSAQLVENLTSTKLKRHNSMIETVKQVETTPTSKRHSSKRLCATEPRPKRKLDSSPIRKLSESTPLKRIKNDRDFISSDDDSLPFGSTSFFNHVLSSTENLSTNDLGVIPINFTKRCVSCKTHRTPKWRDIDENTPLCNICGISWKKNRIRCTVCWFVPLADFETTLQCSNCNNLKTLKKFNSMRRYKSSVY